MLAKELPRKNLKNTTIKKRNSSNSSKRKELSCRQSFLKKKKAVDKGDGARVGLSMANRES